MRAQAAAQTSDLEFNGWEAAKSPLGRLAAETGGSYIPAQVNLTKPIRQFAEDLTTYYVASYVPPIGEYDGRFRAVTVKPLRKDVSVRARSGYFALPPGDLTDLRPFEVPMLALLQQTPLPNEFRVRSRIVQLGELPAGLTQELVVEVPVGELEVRQDFSAGLFSLHATVLAQVRNSVGAVVEHFSQDIRQHGAIDTVETAEARQLSFQRHFVAAPGKYTLELAVLDANSGKTSVEKTAFEVAAAPAGPSVSDMVMVRRTEALPSAQERDADAGDPFRLSSGQVIAAVSGDVPAGAKEVSLFFLIHPGKAAAEKPALEMTVSREGKTVGRVPLSFRQSEDGGAVPYFGTLEAGALKPGSYVAKVRISQSGQSVERSLGLTIAGPDGGMARLAAGPLRPGLNENAADPGAAPDVTAELAPIMVTPMSAGSIAPAPGEVKRVLEGGRKRALGYTATLPNFLCVEVTNRSVDSSGTSKWKHKDRFSEVLSYHDHAETRHMIEVNGERTRRDSAELKGAISNGEFGGVLNAIFEPSAHAEFHWKGSGMAAGNAVHLFEYKVAAKDSSYGLRDVNYQINAAFHGVVSIDAATLGVRQVTLVADDLPRDFAIRASAIGVDYEYLAINGHDYLLPTHAAVSLRRGRHEAILNEMQFRDYRRFGTRSRVLAAAP